MASGRPIVHVEALLAASRDDLRLLLTTHVRNARRLLRRHNVLVQRHRVAPIVQLRSNRRAVPMYLRIVGCSGVNLLLRRLLLNAMIVTQVIV